MKILKSYGIIPILGLEEKINMTKTSFIKKISVAGLIKIAMVAAIYSIVTILGGELSLDLFK